MATNTIVRARIDRRVKDEAAVVPNAKTVRAMKEARRGKLRRLDRVEDVMADLHSKD